MLRNSSISGDRPVRSCRNNLSKPWISKDRAEKEKRRQIKGILKKDPGDRTTEEKMVIRRNRKVVKLLEKKEKLRQVLRQKSLEVEDSAEELEEKVAKLAGIINMAEHLVVYTGAGISTAASIPDYRGPNGVWTLLQQGKDSLLRNNSLVDAKPTQTHMALKVLVQEKKVKHVVSQNCDGLHLRSGVPPDRLSELHGNMYIEVCTECEPERQYIRLFDVTEHTSLRRHKTNRNCHKCGQPLRDTIVHFGEKGVVDRPLNWAGAMDAAEEADAILCLGSSLKVLRRYQCLWNTDRPKRHRPKLFIVNLQWTPKDSQATLKINGRCDDVMTLVMKQLNLHTPQYSGTQDPIFKMSTPLLEHEKDSYTTKSLLLSSDDGETLISEAVAMKTEFRSEDEGDNVSKLKSISGEGKEEPGEVDDKSKGKLDLERNVPPLVDLGIQSNMPGWFGKGCRKKVAKRVGRRRKRSRVSSAASAT